MSLCRFDVLHAVMSLGRFRAAPRQGHLERLKRVVGHLKKRPNGTLRFRSGIPNHEKTFGDKPVRYDWMESICGTPPEQIDERAPEPKGKVVRTTTFCDANLMHDAVTGRSASGILEMLNQTPIDWFCKRQSQVETATHGSEFMVARQATERLIDLRCTLRSFGAPLDGCSWLFGDNKSVVTSSTIPHSSLSKRWNALSYHKVRESIASGWLRFEHIPGTENPADILAKPLPWHMLKVFVEPLPLWKGDTADAPSGSENPEASDASPGLTLTRDSGDATDTNANPVVGAGSAGASIPIELSNNMCAVLCDDDGDGQTEEIRHDVDSGFAGQLIILCFAENALH